MAMKLVFDTPPKKKSKYPPENVKPFKKIDHLAEMI